jgi:hypothetical protein
MEFSDEQICYLNYNQNMTLPEWDIEQERYWQVSNRKEIEKSQR